MKFQAQRRDFGFRLLYKTMDVYGLGFKSAYLESLSVTNLKTILRRSAQGIGHQQQVWGEGYFKDEGTESRGL